MRKLKVRGLEFTVSDECFFDRETLLLLYWSFHPRFRFFKSLPLNSRLIDIGAGNGGLCFWKDWGNPVRNDIKLYAVDIRKGEFFERYEGYHICNLERENLIWEDDFFDAALLSHVLEHIHVWSVNRFLNEVKRVLKPGGRLYVEIPTPETVHYPTKDEFLTQGISVSITNFWDDATNVKTYDLGVLCGLLQRFGFRVLESGVIENKFLEDQMLAYGVRNSDQEITTYAVWSKLRWSQYVIGEKV